ncbi:MAG: FAD-dependent oxidoreductase, partial [Elusimicrobiales bacterium]|nr:FAD-dependent oxidoreductase [Elusimicrobiales bacterium]
MTSSASFDAVVIGAGASGLCAALAAARRGARALVLEAGPSAGRKILASGNGRCNLTNSNAAPDDYLGGGALVRAALDRLSGKQAVEFFESLGVLTALEEGGRVFPRAGKSTAVLTPLLCAAGEAGVKIE